MKTRQVVGTEILAEPGRYCVCEGCGSILVQPVRRDCPACHGYRFDGSERRVVDQATTLAMRAQESVIEEDME